VRNNRCGTNSAAGPAAAAAAFCRCCCCMHSGGSCRCRIAHAHVCVYGRVERMQQVKVAVLGQDAS
jgi:hypothetical protein